VWSRLFAGLTVEAERASRVFVHEIDVRRMKKVETVLISTI